MASQKSGMEKSVRENAVISTEKEPKKKLLREKSEVEVQISVLRYVKDIGLIVATFDG